MGRLQKWQSGTADLLSVVVAMTILSITVAGTSAAMIYGRQGLIKSEHYKAAAFALRGEMEKLQAEIQLDTTATNNPARRQATSWTAIQIPLDNPLDRRGHVAMTTCQIKRDQVSYYPIFEIGPPMGSYWYKTTVRARWFEPTDDQYHEISFTTGVLTRESRAVRN
jgi:hypothetical protein